MSAWSSHHKLSGLRCSRSGSSRTSRSFGSDMDSSNLQCYCGKSFYQLNAFSNHQRHCRSSQQRLTTALSKAQQIWSKKRAAQRLKRVEDSSCDDVIGGSLRSETPNPTPLLLVSATPGVLPPPSEYIEQVRGNTPPEPDTSHLDRNMVREYQDKRAMIH